MLKLTEANYFTPEADKQYMSNSQFKKWADCEDAAYAMYVTGEYVQEPTEAMEFGTRLHQAVNEGIDRDIAFAGLTKSKRKLADDMANAVARQPKIAGKLVGEKELIVTG